MRMATLPWKSQPDLTGTVVGTWVVARDLSHEVAGVSRKVLVRCTSCRATSVVEARKVGRGLVPCCGCSG
jgi:hypothetical protein